MKKLIQKSLILILGAGALLFSGLKTNAQGILLQLNTPFPSDPSPSGSAPWVDAIFQTTNNGVLLTITNVDITSGEFLQGNGNGANGGLYFNLNTNLNPNALAFTLVSSNGSFGPIISLGVNQFKSDGDGYYDIQFDFSTHLFSTDSSISYLITLTNNASLTANDFAYLSSEGGGEGIYYAAAHVQGLSVGGSTWIGSTTVYALPVPEPTTWALSCLGGLSLLLLRRRKY